MKKSVLFSVVGLSLIASSTSFAQNKVVVIPMGSSSSNSSWIKLYDKNNTFMGYTDFGSINSSVFVINDKKYCTHFSLGGTEISPNIENGIPGIYSYAYLTPDCSGNPYSIMGTSTQSYYTSFCDGVVGNANDYLFTNIPVAYVNYKETPLPPSTTYYASGIMGGCESYSGDYLYPIRTNNPSVTGFNNSYPTPIRAEYTLPQ